MQNLSKSVKQDSFLVKVPATSANLGPGFDCLGLALNYHDEHRVRVAESGRTHVAVSGFGAGAVPTDENNLIVASAKHVFDALGKAMPALEIAANNRIPQGAGMGSSAAAIVAGVKIAQTLLKTECVISEHEALQFATEIEGHPDNVAPAIFGGLTIAWTESGKANAQKIVVHKDICPLVLVPDFQVSTKHARSFDPKTVPHADAVFNLSRSALLIAALTETPELLYTATADKLHQEYRAQAMPGTADLLIKLRQAGFAAVAV